MTIYFISGLGADESVFQFLDLPGIKKVVAFTRIHKLFPVRFLKWSNLITADYYFGTTSAKESKLLHQIIQDTDDVFMVWAINCIMTWKNVNIAEDIIHIHGTSDKIFSIRPIKGCIKITDGGHFMIVNKSEEISKIIMSSI